MTEKNTPSEHAVTVRQAPMTPQTSVFSDRTIYAQAYEMAKVLSASNVLPLAYQNNVPNTLVALEIANRMQVSPLMVMQNMDPIHGRPAFNSKFIAALVNGTGLYSKLRYEYSGEGDQRQCIAYAKELSTGDVLKSMAVTVQMAKDEKWYYRSGSKWPTMTDQMLAYRSCKFWQNLYEPGLTMGIPSSDEIEDIVDYQVSNVKQEPPAITKLNETASTTKTETKTQEKPAEQGKERESDKVKVRPAKQGLSNEQIV